MPLSSPGTNVVLGAEGRCGGGLAAGGLIDDAAATEDADALAGVDATGGALDGGGGASDAIALGAGSLVVFVAFVFGVGLLLVTTAATPPMSPRTATTGRA